MTPIKRKLLYIFRDSLLRLRITWNHGTSLTLSVGYHVDKTDSRGRPSWDGSRCRKNTSHGKDKISAGIINKELENLEDRVSKAFFYFENIDYIPTKDELKDKLNPDISSHKEKTLLNMIDEFLIEQSTINQWSLSMLRNCRKCLLYLVEALGPNIHLDDIDNKEYAKLLNFFFNKKHSVINADDIPEIKTGLSNATINNYLNNIRRFSKWAEDKNYTTKCTIHRQKATLKTINKPVIFLDWSELMNIMKADFKYLKSYDIIRDMFCFACFTGLRYSDLLNIKWNNVFEDRIEIVTKKTNDRLYIELNKYSRSILDKLGKTDHDDMSFIFPRVSLKHYNKVLVNIAKLSGINKEIEYDYLSGSERKTNRFKKYECITSHTARRTFVCNSLSIGIPPNVIMKWTGHKNYKSMNPYIDVTSNAKKENMSLFDSLPDIPINNNSENSSDLI